MALNNENEVQKSVKRLMEVAKSHNKGIELVVTILDESAALIEHRQPGGGMLSSDQAKFLVEAGSITQQELAAAEKSVADGELAKAERKTRLEAITETLSADQVAEMLNITSSRVRHRLGQGDLYAFLVGRRRRYPNWQFVDTTPVTVLPGLSILTEAIPEGMHQATIRGFMVNPKEDLRIEGKSVTPVEWLLHGGDAQDVADILRSFLQS